MQSKKSPQFLAYPALILGIVSISFSALFVRWAHAPGVVSSFYRMGLASAIMFLPFLSRGQGVLAPKQRPGIVYAIAGGLFFSLDMFFWTKGIVVSGATIPTVLANTAPLWVGLGSWFFFREQPGERFWIGLLVTVGGASMILGNDLRHSSDLGLGAVFGLVAAIFYGAYHLVSQRGRMYLNTLSYFWVSTMVSAGFLLVYTLILRYPLLGYDAQTWGLFILMGVLVQVLGWMFINYAQGTIPAVVVAPTMLAQPIITAVLAAIFLGEKFTGWHLVGGCMVMVGVYLVHQRKEGKEMRARLVV